LKGKVQRMVAGSTAVKAVIKAGYFSGMILSTGTALSFCSKNGHKYSN
jgi:hypothetical protein